MIPAAHPSLPFPYRVRWAWVDGTSCESFTHESQALAHYAMLSANTLWAIVERWSGRAWSAIRPRPAATA